MSNIPAAIAGDADRATGSRIRSLPITIGQLQARRTRWHAWLAARVPASDPARKGRS
jgi:hypothetical protein